MWSPVIDRGSVEAELAVARRRAWALTTYSPAWDAAMALVEDLERLLWRIDHPGRTGELDLGATESALLRALA